jgi:hypothetical protein
LKDFTKLILISCAFLFFYFALGVFNFNTFGLVNETIDFDVHWNKINDLDYKPDYPMGYHFIFQFFSSSQLFFYSINLFLICIIIPYLLFCITKTHWSAILYFCGISLPHAWLYGATFPQVLVFALLLFYLANPKNPFVYVFGFIFATLVHREGNYLFALVLFAEIVAFFVLKVQRKCFPVTILGVQKFGSIPLFLFYLITQISFPIFIFARKIYKNIFYLILAIVPLLFLNHDARIISVTQIVLLIVASPEIAKSKHKWLIGFILFFYLIFFLLEFAVGTTNLFLK